MTAPGCRPLLIIELVFCVPLLGFFWILFFAISPGPVSSLTQIEVIVPPRSGVSEIGRILAEKKVIKGGVRFAILAKLTGSATKLRAGEYAFGQGARPIDIIGKLKKGAVLYRPVIIPEGTEMRRVAENLAAGGWVDSHRFLVLAHDQDFIRELGISAANLEGYLFPDTYFFSKGQQSEAGIIRMMVERHRQVFNDINKEVSNRTPAMTPHEIIILASIVEKETGNPDERALVAGTFLNRLAKGMRLQADPTVRYGQKDKTGPLTRDELKKPTPYNTYIIKGLPPGPITNPGRAAMEAVLSPAATDYLYFVAKGDSSHHFSRTLQEHNKAVLQYRR